MIKFNDNVQYSGNIDEYSVQMREKKFPWWVLLFLLPLLLLIRCNKTITVNCYEDESKYPVANQTVTMKYDTLVVTKTTDSAGVAVFDSLRTSVFGYVCLFWKDCVFSAVSDCYSCDSLVKNFHYTRYVDMLMTPRRVNLHVKLLDKETGDLLPDGIVHYTYNENGQTKTDSVRTNAAGEVEISNMRYCSKIDLLAKCYGYADTVKLQTPCNEHLIADDSSAMRLRPLKERLDFFVKNKETKEPIAAADYKVTLTLNGREIASKSGQTSTDGKGFGSYDNAHVRATVAIHAEKRHFKPGDLEGGPFTVDKFRKQTVDVRTIWLEPEPFVVEFQCVDSITGRPVPGAKVHITIIDPNGTKTETDEISNSPNGMFPVKAKENSKIIIEAQKRPSYKDKKRIIAKFSESVDKKVRMESDLTTLQFRTTDGTNVLSSCNLVAIGSISGSLKPSNSGSGVFNITFRKDELLSITASKSGYSTNSTKVKNASLNQLGTQSARDIPLKKSWRYDYSNNAKNSTQCYDLYSAPAPFTFDWSVCSVCTMIVIKDYNGNIIDTFGVDATYQQPGTPTNNPSTGSKRLKSPTRKICVIVQDMNSCPYQYHIKP